MRMMVVAKGYVSAGAGTLLLAVLCLWLSACAVVDGGAVPQASSSTVTLTDTLEMPDSTADSGAYTGVSEYRVGPQDLIEISVFQVPDLSRTVRVNSGGQISLPLVGVVEAGGRTVQELEVDIASRLESDFLQNPQVSVFVKEFTSQRVTLEGAVKKPGIYPLTGRTSLMQAIAMAEGLDPLANLQGVVIFRRVNGERMAAVFDMNQLRSGAIADPQIYGDDMIVVDQSGSKTALRRFIESVPAFSLFMLF